MSDDYRKQIEEAVQAVRREEGNAKPFSEEYAKKQIEWHLGHNFVESLKGKGVNPVTDSLAKLLQWASLEYFLERLKDLRLKEAKREHEGRQERMS